MKKLSFWAKNHPWQARFLITFSRITLGFLACFAGIFAAISGFEESQSIFIFSGLLYVAAFLAYPNAGFRVCKTRSFAWRKSCDAALVTSSFMFWLGVGVLAPTYCAEEISDPTYTSADLAITPTAPLHFTTNSLPLAEADMLAAPAQKKMSFFKKLKTWKEVKHQVKRCVETIRQAREGGMEGWKFALLILLNTILVVGLGILTFVLSCRLSCNGQEGAAVAVLLSGVFLVLLLSYLMWKNVK